MAHGIIQTGEFAFCLGTMFGSIQGYFCSESIPGGDLGIIYSAWDSNQGGLRARQVPYPFYDLSSPRTEDLAGV